jgi:hypothetical protein
MSDPGIEIFAHGSLLIAHCCSMIQSSDDSMIQSPASILLMSLSGTAVPASG